MVTLSNRASLLLRLPCLSSPFPGVKESDTAADFLRLGESEWVV